MITSLNAANVSPSEPQAPLQQSSSEEKTTNVDRAIEFFKTYIYLPSSKLVTSNVLDKLEIKDILKLLDDRIYQTINKILEHNKEAQEIYVKGGDRDKIRAIYVEMANIYESLHQVESRVRALYPEEHMLKLFNVLQKIHAKQYQITYKPEEDKKSFWDVFSGS
jgi:acid stress-induced BolA-like protein IbaG/YrbA